MGKKKKKFKTARDWNAVDAHFRNSAGAMKDKRDERMGTRNNSRDFVDSYFLEMGDDNMDNVGEDSNGNTCCNHRMDSGVRDL